MDNRRLLLAVVLSMGVLFLWSYLFAPEPPVLPPQGPDTAEVASPDSSAAQESSVPSTRSAAPAPVAVADSGEAALPEAQEARPTVEATAEERVTLTTDTAKIVLTNRGGQVVSYRLAEHLESLGGEPMDQIRLRDGELYPLGLTGSDGRGLPINDALFTVERPGPSEVIFRYSGVHGDAVKHLRFEEAGLAHLSIRYDQEGYSVFFGPGVRNPPQVETKNRFFRRSAVFFDGDDVDRLESTKVKEESLTQGGGLRWFGLDDSYFLVALLPETPIRQVAIDPVLLNAEGEGFVPERILPGMRVPSERKKEQRDLAMRVMPLGPELEARSYWGAKEYSHLQSLGSELERSVDLGFFKPIARFFKFCLEWIHANVVSNYGWAIVLMTICIKILLLPITWRHASSMRKMQTLNPKIQEVKKRFSNKLKDKQGRPNLEVQRKMNEEVMAVYRNAGVNPAGGCLPMLLQLPIFFAFYTILYGAVELRHAPWALWINDLSVADPFYILPIIMGGTQILQQRMMPMPSGNPLQARIMAMMPIVFTFFFIFFPAGLVLYWLTNNVTTVVQQAVYNRLHPHDQDQGTNQKSAGGKRSGKQVKGAKA